MLLVNKLIHARAIEMLVAAQQHNANIWTETVLSFLLFLDLLQLPFIYYTNSLTQMQQGTEAEV